MKIAIRPLLVEAMIASRKPDNQTTGSRSEWLVLLDQERFPITQQHLAEECSVCTLSPRLRNTIAHELTHSLSFRANEFGFELLTKIRAGESEEEFVDRLEKETESLSPLLLIPYSGLVKTISTSNGSLLNALLALRERSAVSTEVLIARLRLLAKWDREGLILHPTLRDVAVGCGEWTSKSSARIYGWPLFVNFNKGHVPELVFRVQRDAFTEPQTLSSAPDFFLNGGKQFKVPLDLRAEEQSLYLRGELSISVEAVERKKGARFLYVIHYS